MAVYQVSCTVYAPYIADHPSVAFVDEEYGEDRIDGKFLSNGFKIGAHQIEFKLNLKDQYPMESHWMIIIMLELLMWFLTVTLPIQVTLMRQVLLRWKG
jgi:hypothetical protein